MRFSNFLTILIIVLIGVDRESVFAGAREDLTQLLRKVYPEEWSGRIEWYYTPERNVVSDLHDADVRKHDIVYFDSNELKYIHGSIDFDGSVSVSGVYDGEIYVAFYSGSQVPSIDYPEFYPVGGESAIPAYLFLANPEDYQVEKVNDELVVYDLKGSDVYFDADAGYVNSMRSQTQENPPQWFVWLFDQYVTVKGCPWATRMKSGIVGNEDNFNISYLKVEYKNLGNDFFDYARFYPKSSHDDKGNRIVYLGPQRLSADDARERKWPDSLDGWNTLLD